MTVERTRLCNKCKQFKPTKEFKRRLSLAQSRAVLRNPNITTNYIADSKLCKDCQPKRKPPRLLTNKEIRTRITDGDMRSALGEAILAKRKEALPMKRSRVMRERWEKVKAKDGEELRKSLQQQVSRYAKRHHSSAYLSPATKAQNKYNYEQARKIRDDLVRRINMGEVFPSDINLASLIKPKGESQ